MNVTLATSSTNQPVLPATGRATPPIAHVDVAVVPSPSTTTQAFVDTSAQLPQTPADTQLLISQAAPTQAVKGKHASNSPLANAVAQQAAVMATQKVVTTVGGPTNVPGITVDGVANLQNSVLGCARTVALILREGGINMPKHLHYNLVLGDLQRRGGQRFTPKTFDSLKVGDIVLVGHSATSVGHIGIAVDRDNNGQIDSFVANRGLGKNPNGTFGHVDFYWTPTQMKTFIEQGTKPVVAMRLPNTMRDSSPKPPSAQALEAVRKEHEINVLIDQLP
jgi:hypothetical protein